MTQFVDVAAEDELVEARPQVVKVGRREVVLVLWEGTVYALKNRCPHQQQSFEDGVVKGHFQNAPVGSIRTGRENCGAIACPWHRWQFDLATGVCITDPSYRMRSYDTKVEDGRVLVDMGRAVRPKKGAAAS